MSKSKREKSSTTNNNSLSNKTKRNSFVTMYLLAVVALAASCLAFYSLALSAGSPPSSKANSLAACGDKDIWKGNSSLSDSSVATPSPWGSLRPGVYFGMKTKSGPSFLSTGTMWSEGGSVTSRNFRHSVHTDELDHFEWVRNNGRSFGIEVLQDTKAQLLLNATFVIEKNPLEKSGTAQGGVMWQQHFLLQRPTRNNVKPLALSFIHYFGIDCDEADDQPLCFELGETVRDVEVLETPVDKTDTTRSLTVTGFSTLSGWFSLTYTASALSREPLSSLRVSHYGPGAKKKKGGSGLPRTIEKIHRAKEFMRARETSHRKKKTTTPSSDEGILFDDSGDFLNVVEPNAVGVFVQFLSAVPIEVHVQYLSHLHWESRQAAQTAIDANVSSVEFPEKIQTLVDEFDEMFEAKFHLEESGEFTNRQIEVARKGMSGLLGGLGYFHGSPVTGDAHSYVPSPEFKHRVSDGDTFDTRDMFSLFTGTPSRSSFPRGFLWDEGFHQMLMNIWDPYLTMEVVSSWMGCMLRVEQKQGEEGAQCRGGWIPRELILGQEAFKVVPAEFVTQRVDVANPPTLLIAVEKLIEKLSESRSCAEAFDDQSLTEERGEKGSCSATNAAENTKLQGDLLFFLKDNFFSFHDWIQWLISSQGVEPGELSAPADSFRWRGRPVDSSRLAPNTLASGLDDYPRSQYPSDDEHHVDLISWVASSCRIMNKISSALMSAKEEFGVDLPPGVVDNIEKIQKEFYSDAIVLKHVDSLVSLHWSVEDKMFYDVGLIGAEESIDVGVMVRCSENKRGGGHRDVLVGMDRLQSSRGREPSLCPTEFPKYMYPLGDGQGGLQTGKKYSSSKSLSVGFIPRMGYVSIFPLILKLLPADSPQLPPLLDLISSPLGLWAKHGLRSLAKKDLFYQQENAPGDSPYWRGPIWMPINYLALGALRHYSRLEGCSSQKRAGEIYKKLRNNLIKTVLTEYDRTGYFWEIYDDSTGEGMRGHPFSGWTTLFVNIMAEMY